MFEETGVNAFHTDRIFGRMRLVVVELLSDGTNYAVVAAGTTPGIVTTNGAATIALTGAPTGANYWFGGVLDDLSAGTATASVSAQSPSAGTVTIVASGVVAGTRFKFFFIVNRTG